MNRILTQTVFAKHLGFKSASERAFQQLLKKAQRLNLLKIQQSGFQAHSLNHPKIIVPKKDFDFLRFAEEVCEVPSWFRGEQIDGYRLTIQRTGVRRRLRRKYSFPAGWSPKYSSNKWWLCEDCGKAVEVSKPYVSKVTFKAGRRFIQIKCFPCYLELVEAFNLA